jgi:hypothetical protein
MASHGGPGVAVYRLNAPGDAYTTENVREQCHIGIGCSFIGSSTVSVDGLDGGAVSLIVECRDSVCNDAFPSSFASHEVSFDRATLRLRDTSIPVVTTVGGPLTEARPVFGIATLTYKATDDGAGIYRHRLVIDGRLVLEDVVDDHDGKCRDALPGAGTEYQFDYTAPCPSAADGRLVFDVNALSGGSHTVEATLEDAAGNRRDIYRGRIDVVSDPTRRVIDSQGIQGLTNPLGARPGLELNGASASRTATFTAYARTGAGARRQVVSATYPHTTKVVGRLTNGRQPIVGATVSIVERAANAPIWRVTGTARTSRTGTVSVRLSPGPSREVRFAYFADSEATAFVTSPAVRLRVRPRVTLRASPRHLKTGQRVRFAGRVGGGSLPTRGLVITLQAGSAGTSWITFRTVRSRRGGRFSAAYRFTNTKTTMRYRFRALVERQADFPFEAGWSRSSWVTVRG